MLVDRERGADKNAGQSGQGCETGRTIVRVPTMAVPRTTRAPKAVDRVGTHTTGVKY